MKRSGFTLVELLAVLAIVSVLAAIAYPSYASYITKTRRIEGQIALIETMQKQERYFSQNNTYIAFSADSSDPQEKRFHWWSGNTAPVSAYELRGVPCPGYAIAECIELRAMPGTSKVDGKFKDSECETLTLNSAGAQTSNGTLPKCWP